jgi:hypothetical protein
MEVPKFSSGDILTGKEGGVLEVITTEVTPDGNLVYDIDVRDLGEMFTPEIRERMKALKFVRINIPCVMGDDIYYKL